MNTLYVNALRFPVTALGPGRRFVVWTQGCGLACTGCMARDTWSRTGGTPWRVSDLVAQWEDALAGGADGITISGGEPLDQPEPVAELLAAILDRSPRPRLFDVLLFSGYELAEAWRRAPGVMTYADAAIVGPYRERGQTRLIWRGSANQRLVPLTERGRDLYESYVDYVPDRVAVQYDDDGEDVRLIGVPDRAEVRRLERFLALHGVRPTGSTWRL